MVIINVRTSPRLYTYRRVYVANLNETFYEIQEGDRWIATCTQETFARFICQACNNWIAIISHLPIKLGSDPRHARN